MSQENVEIVRSVFESVSRRDADAVLAAYDPDLEWDISHHVLRPMFGCDVYRGRTV